MSGVFRNIVPPPPHRLVSVYSCLLAGWRGGGGSIVSEDARHCSIDVSIDVSTLRHNPTEGGERDTVGIQDGWGGGGGEGANSVH